MISAEAFDAYNKAVAGMSDGLSEQCAARVLAFCETHPNATVAEIRKFAIEVMDGFVQVAGEAAASLAAEWYDARMSEEGLSLPAAITAVVYKPEKVEDVARYQARKLVKGDMQGFAERCGEYVRNEALASLNETIIANVARDTPKGVRYARVTTGRENCAFCLMLESRGAVYHSRETAGEMKRYHRGCDCKVVPGVADDEFAILVEGHDPREAYDRWQELEKEAEEKRRRESNRKKHPKKTPNNPVKWSDQEIELLATPENISSWLASKGIEATEGFLKLSVEMQKGAIAGFKHVVETYGYCDVARFDAISDSLNMGRYNPITGTIRISNQVDDPFLTGLHEAMHALDNHRSGKIEPLDNDAYGRAVVASVRKKLRASNHSRFADLVTFFAGMSIRQADIYITHQEELLPVAAENYYLGKRDKLTVAIIEEVSRYDQDG